MRRVLVFVFATLVGSPAFAQIDIAGVWRPLARDQDGSGMDGDYAGLPLSEAGRWRALSCVPENFEVAEWVCRPHAFDYSIEAGPARLRFVPEVEDSTQRIVAYHGRLTMREQANTIWLDDRPRPPDYARHSWSGFNTGVFEGDTLVQTSTHLKEAYLRRWGPMRSDQSTVRYRWKRIGNYLRATVIMYDPVYLAEPYIRTSLFWVLDPDLQLQPYPCEEATETVVEPGSAPHALPGQSLLPAHDPALTDAFGTPYEPRMGGPETMYPEYIATMKMFAKPTQVAGGGERGQ
jgi:hypothetical protein